MIELAPVSRNNVKINHPTLKVRCRYRMVPQYFDIDIIWRSSYHATIQLHLTMHDGQ